MLIIYTVSSLFKATFRLDNQISIVWIVSQFTVEAIIAAIMAIAVFKAPP